MVSKSSNLGNEIKQRRLSIPGMIQKKLAELSGVSPSHLGRIERGERFPSARILRKIAKPLWFDEGELFRLANYLSPAEATEGVEEGVPGHLDPVVAKMLAQETIETQRAVIGILSVLKGIAKGIAQENR